MKTSLTFRELIQSFKDFDNQDASVMPYIEGAEDPSWGISEIWFKDGILMLGQDDDEGYCCANIVEKIEACLPKEALDMAAIIKIGPVSNEDGEREIVDIQYAPAEEYFVVKNDIMPFSERVDDDDVYYDEDEEDDDGAFCKWVPMLK